MKSWPAFLSTWDQQVDSGHTKNLSLLSWSRHVSVAKYIVNGITKDHAGLCYTIYWPSKSRKWNDSWHSCQERPPQLQKQIPVTTIKFEESLWYEWLDGLWDFQPSEGPVLLRLYWKVTSMNKQAINETFSLSMRYHHQVRRAIS